MQDTINALSNQVDRLNDKLSQMQENDRSLIDMERLTRAEQRAESLRAQQVDVESKLADLQVKLEQIEYALKPENIERAAGFGTVHPEEARETRRRQLESEKARTQAQIRILETSRARLETAVNTADAEVDALRRRIGGATGPGECGVTADRAAHSGESDAAAVSFLDYALQDSDLHQGQTTLRIVVYSVIRTWARLHKWIFIAW